MHTSMTHPELNSLTAAFISIGSPDDGRSVTGSDFAAREKDAQVKGWALWPL